MPSDKTSQTSLWNPHRRKVKGEMEVEFLPTCGAAQEKQSAAALPSSNPNALPLYFVWGFWPLAKTGAIPRTGFQVPPCTVRCTVRDGAFDVHTAGLPGEGRVEAVDLGVATPPKVTQETRGVSAGLTFTCWCLSSFPSRFLSGFLLGVHFLGTSPKPQLQAAASVHVRARARPSSVSTTVDDYDISDFPQFFSAITFESQRVFEDGASVDLSQDLLHADC